MFTDAAGARAAVEAGLPAIVVPDARAALGPAAAAIYGEPATRLTLIGITGTAGKTSTAYLIESGLRAAGHVTGLIGTVETRLGDLVVDSVRTTPEASDLHGLFAVAVERGVTAMVMEVSSHALALDRVGGTRFAVGGYTNFGSDHLDFHRDADDYFAAKAKLFDGRCDIEILNADDPALEAAVQAGDGDVLGRWRHGGDLAGRRRAAATGSHSGSPRTARTVSRWPPAYGCPAGTMSPMPCSPSRAWPPSEWM